MKKIIFPTNDGLLILREPKIEFVKSENIYTYVHCGNEKYFTSCSLKEIESILDSKLFYRCHKSYIVNLDKIMKITKTSNCQLMLSNGNEIPVSRTKKKELITIVMNRVSNTKIDIDTI